MRLPASPVLLALLLAACGGGGGSDPCPTGPTGPTSPCPTGQAYCGGRCVDPATNRGFCGASGLCSGTAAGAVCRPDQICNQSACACPEGQTACGDGSCQFVCDPASRPGLEWKASVPLTAPPRFPESSSTLAHILFDGTDMVDSTEHTTWASPALVAAASDGMWTPAQPASGPFTSDAFWRGDAATRDYLAEHTAGDFTVCARYAPGTHPGMGPDKVVVSLGQPQVAAAQGGQLGGWALTQVQAAAGFRYYADVGHEWMASSSWPADGPTLAELDWTWQCGGWNGSGISVLRGATTATGIYYSPAGSSPLEPGFPAGTLEVPAIGDYRNGAGALTDGTVYEIVMTSDPATETNMKNLVARAAGGLRIGNEVPVPVIGADGAVHLAPPTTVRVNLDGSIDADQEVLLGSVLPASPDPATSGQCWGIDAEAADWLATNADSFALKWISQDGNHDYRVNWRPGGTMCLAAVQSDPWVDYFNCWNVGPTPGRHRFQYCIAADRTRRIYVDGVQVEGVSEPIPLSFLPHLEDPSTSLLLGSVSSRVKLWRVWACAGEDPAACR